MSKVLFPFWFRDTQVRFDPGTHWPQMEALICLEEWETASVRAYWTGDVNDTVKAEILRREYDGYLEKYRDWHSRQREVTA